MKIEKSVFGTSPEGEEILLYTMTNSRGMQAAVTNLGAILVKLCVPDQRGGLTDVVLGFDNAREYYGNPSFFGAVIGPSANRIGGASFTLEGVTYQLDVNDNGNNLHSHRERGYHKRLWDAKVEGDRVVFMLEDVDGGLGFPGNKRLQVVYTLEEDNSLKLHYHGQSDRNTILNPTNHTYFNLNGQGSGTIEDHELYLKASRYTPVSEGSIPTGEITPVKGTPMDFTLGKPVGREINGDFEQLALTGGYDHNWVIDGWDESLQHFATVKAPESGISMYAYTTLPGVQFYAGNFIDTQQGKSGAVYRKRSGLCLETQYFPDSIHNANFPSCVFGGDREYDSVTVYRFG